MAQVRRVSCPFRPSQPITGQEADSLYRAANLMLSGKLGENFYRSYAGSRNINETFTGVAITGTISFSAASTTITGTGTSFLNELHRGQIIVASNGEPIVVDRLVTTTSFIASRLPTTTGVTLAATIPPRLEAMDVYRMALAWGNPVVSDKGNILTVGSGVLYKNGAVLPGTSLTASRTLQLSLYSSASSNYSTEAIGFSVTPLTANTDVTVVGSGGTKNTALGFYSFKVGYYNDDTNGYSNPGATLLSGGTTGYQVTAANSTFQFDFTTDVANRPSNSTGYVIYASAYTNSSDQSAINAIQGAWYEVKRVPYTSIGAGDIYAFDYVDADLGNLVSFDNDTPPDADWVSLLAGYVTLVSTNGQGVNSGARVTETSPGPYISPQKGNNLDGYPATYRVPTEKGEDIIGCVSTAGRLFVMTANTLQATTPTGLDTAPMTLRPFWKTGFANPYNVVAVNDQLYGFTSKGMYRSIATGDSAEATNDFASSVNDQMENWSAGHVYTAYDPKNRCVCVFNTGAYKNTQGYWVTEVYVYNLDIWDWTPPIILSDSTRDMIVTGVATVQGVLYFIAGGRRAATTVRFDTFAWDDPLSGASVPWYMVWAYSDSGSELIAKRINKVRPKGHFTDGALQLYALTPDTSVDEADLEDGFGFAYQTTLDPYLGVRQYPIFKTRVRNASMWTVRLEGVAVTALSYDECDEIHEIVLDVSVSGQER